ncbi:hypothetical protein [Methylobacterium aquaticum]|uniref:hypothetical protein n=1 Tax=Methylobacterium aquaticum TaxID=270351 RepID=UPI0019319A02|nr:hypothetical protein [Methylobacterium aquaticum]QRE77359.1 hypothetical protein F1D61_30965 [Methylobacterium aquaticum]
MGKEEILAVASAVQGKLEELAVGIIDHLDLGDWLEANGHDVVNALRCVALFQPRATPTQETPYVES